MAELAELGTALTTWQLADTPVCAVRLTDLHGLGATQPAQLLLTDGVTVCGSLLGGTADAVALQLAGEVLASGEPRRSELRLDTAAAVDAGAACAGSVTVFAHLMPGEQTALLAEALRTGAPVAMVAFDAGVLVTAGRAGEQVSADIAEEPAFEALEQTRELLRRGVSCTSTLVVGEQRVPVDVWVPRAGLLLVGAGSVAAALAAQAELLGWTVQIRTTVAETEQAVAALTAADAVVLLDHSPAFDGALLRSARGPAFTGALGSRHTQAERRERLVRAGATEAELDRIHGPVGLDLGAKTPAETAVSVVAQMIAHRSGRAPQALSAATGRIGG